MPNRLYTTFQNMSKVFDGSWNVSNGIANTETEPHGNEIIYTTEDPQKLAQKKLEMQQNAYLQNRWVKTNQNLSMSAFAGLSNIKLMYRDADLMDSYPEIGAALDLISEECSLTTSDSHGMVVKVSSKSDRIKSILEDLFVNRLNLQVTAQMVIRAMCKYGNQFMLLDIDKNLGVKGWRQLPVAEVERVENGIINPYMGAGYNIANNAQDPKDLSTKFIWTNEQGGQLVPFRNWQIAHFRLLHNSLFLPYGSSALLSARRHFRMLALMEDSMLIYRLERSMERRVYKIYVGALDDNDIGPFIDRIADQFKRTPIVDPLTGQLDLRKNLLPVWKNTPIPLVDGRSITIEKLAQEYESGKLNYVYSIQDGTHQIVPGKVVWCGKNYTAQEMYKITLKDNTYMVMAGEHEILMSDGSKKRADEVTVNEAVMPFYRKDGGLQEQVYNPHSEQYEFTIKMMEEIFGKTEGLVPENDKKILHKDCTISKIEIIGGDDVYCMTVVGINGEEDRHNFALQTFNQDETPCMNGCFVSNCASEDLFIPVRDANAATPIDTLAGAKNLDAIDDIKYIQKKVCAALRIPQSFLNFEEATGDGKNLALMDVRFARTVNRYQQAFLMELTKIATIHLYLLGFEDDLTNFNLTMNNPSTQAEQLEIENLAKKISAARDAVSDPGNGIPIMSLQRALKEILKWSDKEIKDNFDEIRLEKALAAEYEKTGQIIKRTGLFDNVDRIYGEPGAEYQEEQGGMDGPDGGGPMGGGGFGGSFGGGLDDMGAPGSDAGMDMQGQEGIEPTQDMGGPDMGGQPTPDGGGMPMESFVNSKKPLILETPHQAKHINHSLQIFNQMIENIDKKSDDKEVKSRVDVYDKSLMISEEFDNMLNVLEDFKNATIND